MQCEKKRRLRMHVGIVHGTFIMRTRAIGKGGEDSEMAPDYCAPLCTLHVVDKEESGGIVPRMRVLSGRRKIFLTCPER